MGKFLILKYFFKDLSNTIVFMACCYDIGYCKVKCAMGECGGYLFSIYGVRWVFLVALALRHYFPSVSSVGCVQPFYYLLVFVAKV